MKSEFQIRNNEKNQRFEIVIENEIAFLEYRWNKDDLVLMHTLVPPKFERMGLASSLAKFALEHAKEKHLTIIVYCPFVVQYVKTHTEYNFLLKKVQDD